MREPVLDAPDAAVAFNGQCYPSWYTPSRLLTLFCWVTFLVFLDRGVLASNGVNQGIQEEYQLTLVENGILPTAFLLGLLVASVIYSELTKRYSAFRLIGIGTGIWAASAVACGLTNGFWSLLLCRVVMGAGEASVVNLTGPFIDDVAPPAAKTLWFAILYLCPTLGIAGGYIFGGVAGSAFGWRVPFFLEAIVALPVVAWTLCAPVVPLRTLHAEAHGVLGDGAAGLQLPAAEAPLRTLGRDLAVLAAHPVYIYNVLAYCPIQGAFGVYSYWGPQAGYALFGISEEAADLTFGIVTIATSIVATLLGGAFLDLVGSSVRNAVVFCAWSTLAGFLVTTAAFVFSTSFPMFMVLFALGELAIFAGTAPSSAVSVWAVPLHLRSLGSGMATVANHLLGDVPTPPLVGLLQSWLQDWRWSLTAVTLVLLPSAALYLLAACTPYREYRSAEELGGALEPLKAPVPEEDLLQTGEGSTA